MLLNARLARRTVVGAIGTGAVVGCDVRRRPVSAGRSPSQLHRR